MKAVSGGVQGQEEHNHNDFNRWGAWSPWEKKDPAMKRAFGAATSGKGAVYAWEGNMDSMVGSDFEAGLAGLKAIAEK